MAFCESNTKRNVYSDKHLFKKRERSEITNLILPFRELEKEEQTNPSTVRGKEVIKI